MRRSLILLLAVLLGTAGCAASSGASDGRLQVVVAENPWTDLVTAVGGDRVHVTTVIKDPGGDPHLYSADVDVARAVSRASLVVTNGLGYDEFMTKLLAASPRDGRTVVEAATAMGVSGGAGTNPHLWYDLAKVPAMVTAVADALSAADPAGAAGYRDRAAAWTADLQPLLAQEADLRARTDALPRRPEVASTEPVAEYLLKAVGLADATPPAFTRAVQNESEPPASGVAELRDLVRSGSLSALVYNTQTTDRLTEGVRSLAKEQGVVVVEVSETVPTGMSYLGWQRGHLDALSSAIGGVR